MLMTDYTAKLLNLEDVIITKVENISDQLHISIELPRRKHMGFSVVANWGEIGKTTIRICELSQWKNHPIFNKNDEIL